jgi:hypothetical protein
MIQPAFSQLSTMEVERFLKEAKILSEAGN